MIKVTDVAYARFRAPDLEKMEDFLIDFGLTHGTSKVRFVLVFTVFFRCWTFCTSSARRTEKPRKNCCFGLEKRGPKPPGEARTSRFQRQNGQV